MTLSEPYYSVKSNLIFCLSIPIYVMLFMVLYSPTFGINGHDGWLSDWNQHAGLCLPIICAIILGVLLASRSILCFALVRHTLSKREFLVWQAVEFLVCCLFCDLFLSLYLHADYFVTLTRIIIVGLELVIFPYVIYWAAMELLDHSIRLREANDIIAELRKGTERNEAGAIRFADEKGNVKLVVGAERVISIESAGNYVTILYDNDGKLVRYSLRNTLKSIEDICRANGLVRCHRSFFVNLSKIKIIRRTPDGIYAEIDRSGVEDIPVSKTYAAELMRLFSE
jgi:hypothetical protein